jgi:hypothetical protein
MTENALDGVKDIPFLERFSQDLGYVPKFLKDKIEGGALAGNGAESLNIYTRMLDGKPLVVSQINQAARSILNTAAGYVRNAAMSPEEALTQARELLLVPEEQRSSRQREYSSLRAAGENVDSLEDLMSEDKASLFASEGMLWGRSMVSEVDPSRQQIEEFEYLTEQEFIKTGDIQVSRRNAYQLQRPTWGPSGVGGAIVAGELETGLRSSKYPPERMLNQTTEQVNDTLTTFAMANGLLADDLILKDTPNTARGVAEWRVYQWDKETKVPVPIMDEDTGRELIFDATVYQEFKTDLLEIQGIQDAAQAEGLIEENGKQTAWAVRKLKGEIDAQSRIDSIIEGMASKPKATQYMIAERIVGNKNASPDQIKEATQIMQRIDKARISKGQGAAMPSF